MSRGQGVAIWGEISAQEVPATLRANQACVAWVPPSEAPIDRFLQDHRESVTSGTPSALAGDARLAEHLLLDLVSSTEAYFRTLFTRLIHFCPISREAARTQTVSVLAATSYSGRDIGFAVMDGGSLASAKNVRSRTQQLLGLALERNGSVEAALEQFDVVCHLRHAAVHSRGVVGSNSLAQMGAHGMTGLRRLDIDFSVLQAAAGVCETLVRAYNRYVYSAIVTRWIDRGEFSGAWSSDRAFFEPVFDSCYSVTDGVGTTSAWDAYKAVKLAEGI